jgi:hypothetical protein
MTQDEQLVLAKGRVPAQPILAAVIEHIKAHDDGLVNGPYLEVISEKSGQPLQTLMVWTSNPARCPTLPFDVADRLLCATHLWGMWFGELREYYERVDLTWYQCAHPSCLVTFQRHFVRCSFKGCMTGAHARGLCHKHLERVSYHARKEAKETGVSLAEILDRDHPKTGHSGKAARAARGDLPVHRRGGQRALRGGADAGQEVPAAPPRPGQPGREEDGFVYNLEGVRRVIYRCRRSARPSRGPRTIYVVEGEKDADRLWERASPRPATRWARASGGPSTRVLRRGEAGLHHPGSRRPGAATRAEGEGRAGQHRRAGDDLAGEERQGRERPLRRGAPSRISCSRARRRSAGSSPSRS